jgi:hypothetical protein
MAGKPVGTMYVELTLDATKYTRAQKEILKGAQQNSADINRVFKTVGTQSDQMYNAMRANIENALTAIKKSHLSSADEIRRAQESAQQKITEINKKQFGEQASLIDRAKAQWVGLSVAAIAAYAAVQKAVTYMDQGAKALQQESSFKIVAEQSGIMADTLIGNMKRLTRETIDDSDLMQKATKLMLAGFDAGQIERFSAQAVTASRIAGVSVSEAFDALGDAIANRTPKAMVKLGAVTREQMKIVEAAIKAGADSTTLFELAMTNLELKALLLKGTLDDSAISLQRFHARTKETQEAIGKGLIIALDGAYRMFQYLAAGILGVVSAYARYRSIVYQAMGDEEKARHNRFVADAAYAARNELLKEAAQYIGKESAAEQKASSQEIDDAKKRRDALVAKLKAMGEAGKDASRILKSLMDANKMMYEAAIGETDRWLQRQRDAGADELATMTSYYDKRWAAAEQYYEADKAAIQSSMLRGAAKTAALTALDRRYEKEKSDLLTKEERDQINYNTRHLAVMAQLYKTADQYSAESNAAQVALIKSRYVEDGRWASATKGQRILLEKAMNTEILKLVKQLEVQKRQVILSYMKTAETPDSTAYRDQLQAQLDAQADLMEIELRGTGVVFDRKAWINAQLLDFDRQQMESKTAFYEAIEGFEAKALETGLAAIELRRQAEIKLYGDIEAANKKASDAEGKLAQDLFLKKTKYISDGFGDMSKAFDGISKLYKEGSSAAKRWQDASKAMEVAQRAVAVVNAVAAIANQGLGDPYTAFARIAAMAAAMGALLASIGESLHGGHGGSGGGTSNLPASTRLGAEAGVGSESITRSYDLLQDTYSMEYRELTRIWKEIRNLDSGLKGLVTSILRTGTGGISVPVGGLGSTPGTVEGIYNTFTDMLGPLTEFFSFATLGLNKILGVNNWISSALGSVFGGSTTKKVTQSGLALGEQSVADLLAGEGMDAQAYARIRTQKSGGWFSSGSTSYKWKYAELDSDVRNMIDKVYQGMAGSLVELSRGLGVDVQKALEYVFSAEKLDLKGLSGEALNKKLSDYFSNVADKAADALFGDLIRKYQKLDEGLMETAVRLITNKEVVLNILRMTNQQITVSATNLQLSQRVVSKEWLAWNENQKKFGGVIGAFIKTSMLEPAKYIEQYGMVTENATMQTIAITEALVELAGGLDKLQEAANAYYNNFFSDTEKATLIQEQLTEALGDMEMAMPKTRMEYRALIEEQNLMTEEGRENYVTLLKMAESMASYFDLMEKVMQKAIDAQAKVVSELQGYVNKLKSARESMRMEGAEWIRQQTVQAQLAFNAVLNAARGGDLSGIANIDRSLNTLVSSASSTSGFRTREDYQRNFYQTYNAIAELEGLAGSQLSIEQQTLNVMQDQLEALRNIEANTGGEPPVVTMPSPIGHAATGGILSSGWRIVGEQGPELEYGGPSDVIDNPKTRALIDNTAVVAEIRQLREELQAANYQIAKNTNKASKVLDRWDIDGIPEERTLT